MSLRTLFGRADPIWTRPVPGYNPPHSNHSNNYLLPLYPSHSSSTCPPHSPLVDCYQTPLPFTIVVVVFAVFWCGTLFFAVGVGHCHHCLLLFTRVLVGVLAASVVIPLTASSQYCSSSNYWLPAASSVAKCTVVSSICS